jgi:ATP-binding cassette, subfamily B (MDR/TAP), member 1
MAEKEEYSTQAKDVKEKGYDERLSKLPERYKDEILKQYDLPEAKATLVSVMQYATWKEVLLMVVGTFMSMASGAALPLMTVVFGNLTNVFGGFGTPGATTVQSVPSASEFNSLVTKNALYFVYIGIGVLVAAFTGTLFWTLSGERISRRIRGYAINIYS